MDTLWFIFAIGLCATNTHSQELKNITSCYYCESAIHGNCADPFDPAKVKPIGCVDFVNNKDAPKIDVRFREKRQIPTLGLITDFRCVKLRLSQKDKPLETIRMCAPITKNITSGCENLRSNILEDFTISTCTECDKDNCNFSNTMHRSNLVGIIFTMLIFLTNY